MSPHTNTPHEYPTRFAWGNYPEDSLPIHTFQSIRIILNRHTIFRHSESMNVLVDSVVIVPNSNTVIILTMLVADFSNVPNLIRTNQHFVGSNSLVFGMVYILLHPLVSLG